MNKIILVCLFAVLAFAGARKAPRTHSDFFWSAPNDQFILGYFLDWGHGPFDPTVASAGISRLKDLDLIYFSFIITTYEPNIVWGGKGYADGNLVEGYFAFNNCTLYAPQRFELSFCSSWNANGYCSASGIECPSQNPKGGWCASERFNPIVAASIASQQPFGVSLGGWSDTMDTCETATCAQTLGNNMVAFVNGINNVCGEDIITAIDFDFEHLSTTNSSQQRMNRINSYANLIVTIRNSLPNIILSYTTRFNAFLNYSQGGVEFVSNMEGVTVAQAFTNLGYNIAEVFSFVNIMAYDTPPSNISPDGWVISAYAKILQSFDNRHGGIFAPSQIVIGVETGQQAAGGIYPGYERTMCLANYVYQNNYKGISIWAPNQFTYRYKDQDNQVACNFTNSPFNQSAWEMGWPSGADPHNPNCQAYPINPASKQFNVAMASCIENIGPYMANQISQVFDGTMQVPESFCSAPAWNPCGMCANGTMLVGSTCQAQCTAPQVSVNGVCQCPSGWFESGNTCEQIPTCTSPQVLVNNQCQCPAGSVQQGSTCGCAIQGQTWGNGMCSCPSGQVVQGNSCGCSVSGQTLMNGMCSCPSGQTVQGNSCGCSVSGQTLMNGMCSCPSGQVVQGSSCGCAVTGAEWVNGACSCQNGQVEFEGACITQVQCPTNTYQAPKGQACPAGKTLTGYPGCCCQEQYNADGSGKYCFAIHPTCNCTQWMVTEQGQEFGIPVRWCYTDCYSPDSFPVGLHIACSPFLYQTYPNGTTTLTNQNNNQDWFCGCTEQPAQTSSDPTSCNTPPSGPAFFSE